METEKCIGLVQVIIATEEAVEEQPERVVEKKLIQFTEMHECRFA